VKRGGSLSFLVGTITNILVMEIGCTDVGSGGYILVSCAHSNTSFIFIVLGQDTSTPVSKAGKDRCDKGFSGGRGLTVCCGQTGN
jgi:hypothetical protein